MEQSDLFAAAQERDKAMRQVDLATHESWKLDADEFIHQYLLTHPTLFVDDLWDAGLTPPPSPRALGPRMLAAVKQGWMRRSGSYRRSVRSHMSEKPVWQSLIYRGE